MNRLSNDIKLQEMYQQIKSKCVCGHTQVIPAFLDEQICKHCGRKIINKSKHHFIYKLRKELANEKDEKKK